MSAAPPEIVEPPTNVGIEIEGNGTLPCTAVGMPPPKISWRRGDGRPLATNGRFRQEPTGQLSIAGQEFRPHLHRHSQGSVDLHWLLLSNFCCLYN